MTGVQTCALPIYRDERFFAADGRDVHVEEHGLRFDPQTMHLSVAEGGRRDRRADADARRVPAAVERIGEGKPKVDVKKVEDDGRLRLVSVGDTHPWIWGEGPLLLLGDRETVPGVLSFGSRHVSEASPQRAQLDDKPVRWRDVWVETKRTPAELAEAGVHSGTRAILPTSRHEPVALGADGEFLACPALDDRVGVAILILLA